MNIVGITKLNYLRKNNDQYENFPKGQSKCSNPILNQPYADIFFPSNKPKKEISPKAILSGVINTCQEEAKKWQKIKSISAAIDKSDYFKDKDSVKKELLKDIRDYDLDNVLEKISFFNNPPFSQLKYPGNYYNAINYVLKNEELDLDAVYELLHLTESMNRNHLAYDSDKLESRIYDFYVAAEATKDYKNFDLMDAKEKHEFIERNLDVFRRIDFKEISNNLCLNDVSLINDIIKAGSVEELQSSLRTQMITGNVEKIEVNKSYTDSITDSTGILSLEKLSKTLNNTNLDDFKNGIPLKYPREDFIKDFQNEVSKLSEKDRKAVYKYFKFNINENSEMTGYPIPNSGEIMDSNKQIQDTIEKCSLIVNKYMLNNEVKSTANSEFTDTMNSIIKAFPEFVVVIGKKTHKNESLDYHTMKVIQGIVNNPQTKTLSEEDRRIVILSALFHDFSKKEEEIDKMHPMESSRYANEIIKKLNISNSDKERIYTQILHSHWYEELNDNKINAEDIAVYFRTPNDFKIAKIITDADINADKKQKIVSEKLFNNSQIGKIESNIENIHTTGSLIYNTKFPSDQSLFPRDKDGVKVLDFTDKTANLGQYGFKEGLTPMDFKSFVHCPPRNGTPEKMLSLCNDKQDVVLSTILYNNTKDYFKYATWNPSSYVLMIDSTNSDIILGGPTVSGTGGKRGYEYVKDVLFDRVPQGLFSMTKSRMIIPEIIKSSLSLNDVEYGELYAKIANYESIDDIPQQVILSNDRKISKEDIAKAIDDVYAELFSPENLSIGNGYQNEICIYKPKVQAFAVPKKSYENGACNKNLINTAKKYDIPIVLI